MLQLDEILPPALPPQAAAGTAVPIHAVPKSPANKIEGWVEDANGQKWLKVKIAAPPEDGKANKTLLKFLAQEWKILRSSLTLVSGGTSRYKKLRYSG